ncbi:MAG: PKD domain-containing protein [Bacteroidia bacterium]|nr:PKD domain-containing protein [Bacteroidia bacterium]
MKFHILLLCIVSLLFIPLNSIKAQLNAGFVPDTLAGCSPLIVNFTNTSTGNFSSWLWNLGNGITSVYQDVQAIYTQPGNYTVTLIISNGITSDTAAQTISVFAHPIANFSAVNTAGCKPFQAIFQDLSSVDPDYGSEIIEWNWTFGDGGNSEAQSPVHIYSNTGVYSVTLHIIDINACEANVYKNQYIQVVLPPVANFYANNTYTCDTILNVQFYNTSTGTNNTYVWNFGDDYTSTTVNPAHVYDTTGIFDVKLNVTDQFGCSDSIIKPDYIQLTEFNPSFTLSNDTICLGSSISFLYTPVGLNSKWYFGDGDSSIAQIPQHIYADTGHYTITLIVTDASGSCIDSIQQSVYVENIIASFITNTAYGCDTLLVTFTDQSYNAAAWLWDFGDGTTSTIQNPSHSYISAGTFIASLTASTTSGCQSQAQQSISIVPPYAGFSAFPVRLCVDSLVNFTDNSYSVDSIISWFWDFGDNTNSNEQNPQHIYTTGGDFNAVLTIENTLGCTETDTVLIEVGTKQNPDFIIENADTCASGLFSFSDISTDSTLIDQWLWYFEDGGQANSQDVQHQFTDTIGWHEIQLVVGYNGCFSDTMTDSVFVRGPIAQISFSFNCDTPYIYNFELRMLAADSLGIIWGNGDTLTQDDLCYGGDSLEDGWCIILGTKDYYPETGNFPVVLTVFNDTNQCSFSVSTTIMVRDILADFSMSDSLPCWNEPVQFNGLDSNNSSRHAEIFEWTKLDTAGTITPVGATDLITHTFYTRGDYKIRLVAADINGCKDTTEKHLRVYQPQPGFISDTTSGCYPFPVAFTDTSVSDSPINEYPGDTNLIAWTWYFGDGTSATEQNPVHTYNQQGLLNVTLTVTDTLGCVASVSKTGYIISPKPNLLFSATDTQLCEGDSISFNNNTSMISGYSCLFTWNLGDSTIISAFTPACHTYSDSGYYSITLYGVDTILGCDTTLTLPDYIHVQSYPVVHFAAHPPMSDCYVPSPSFTFIDSTIHPYPYSWTWNFGDGTSDQLYDSLISPMYSYQLPDTYRVSLLFSTTYGCSGTDTIDVIVKGPLAQINYPDSVCRGISIPFIISDTSNLFSYNLYFGDGSSSGPVSEDTIYHIFNYHGIKYPVLILESYENCIVTLCNENCFDTLLTTHPLFVHELIADFSGADSIVCVPYYVYYQDRTQGPIDSWYWNFGNNSTSAASNPYTEYENPGEYIVKLVVTNEFGCADSIIKTLTISPVPQITISDTSLLCKGESVTLTIASSPGLTYTWNTGDSGSSIIVTPDKTATYIVTDNHGCSKEYIVKVDRGIVDIPTAFSPNGDGQNDFLYVAARDVKELIEFKIYNRWGQLIFETTDINDAWDGNYKGIPQNTDTYVYVVRVITNCGTEELLKGYVTLIK